MSCAGRTLLNKLSKRTYVSEAAVKNITVGQYDVKSSTQQKNNIPLVLVNEKYPLSRVTVAFRSGSRYETGENLGITNIIRSSVGLGTKHFTKYGISRYVDINGLLLYATTDREIFSVTMEGHRENIAPVLVYLASVATSPDFKPWELTENIKHIQLEHSAISDQLRAVDILHYAAYKTGPGNSLFVPEHKLSKFTQEKVTQYYQNNFTTGRALVAGYGVDYELLSEFGNFLELPPDSNLQPEAPKFYGGEERYDTTSSIVNIAVAGEGPGYTKKESAAYGVLSYLYGSRAPFKYSESSGIISKAVSKVGPEFCVSTLNISYPDTGLVGFLLTVPVATVNEAYDAALNTFLKGAISDNDVAKAKSVFKSEFLSSVETNAGLLEFFIKQQGETSAKTPSEVVAAIEAVTAADVKQAAKKVSSGNIAVGIVGNSENIPYICSLK